jgi:tetratricopeptide (TPR) repeat protein
MAKALTLRQRVVLILCLWYDVGRDELGQRTKKPLSQSRVSQLLTRVRKREMKDAAYERLLAGVVRRPATVPLTQAFVEAFDALDQEDVLTLEEQASIERSVLEMSRLLRGFLRWAALRTRRFELPAGRPSRLDQVVFRGRAAQQIERLRKVDRRSRFAVVRLGREYHHWALVERCCEESENAASSSLKDAAAWARLAMMVARFVTGPEGWLLRLRSYALAHWANVLRVQGRLLEAEATLEEAKALWKAGSDPGKVLDPGRLLDLEGSLRRDQRRFPEAFALFDKAILVTRFPERVLIKRGTTYDVMGDYEQAVSTLLAARPGVERRGDARLRNMLLLNVSSNLCHLSRHGEAAELVEEVRRSPAGLGKIDRARIPWLEGRIQAGLGNPEEARRLLSRAREKLAAEGMTYDVALALLEEAALLLAEGRTGEVKALALELAKIFEAKGVHPEALNALRVFDEAVRQEKATADLARRILRFLFKARHDQGLRFES